MNHKDRVLTAILALFLGCWGVHRFYLGQTGRGVVYVLLSFVLISPILGFIDFLHFIFMSDYSFDLKFNQQCAFRYRHMSES